MTKFILLISILIFSILAIGQNTATITVSISNIEPNNSEIFIGLYDNEIAFKKKLGALDSLVITPKADTQEVSFKNIMEGDYAIAIFQDINNNGKLDVGKFKIPTEPVGISNYNPKKSKLPPTFNKAKFTTIGDTLILIRMIY